MPGKNWTKEEDEILKQAYLRGMPLKQIWFTYFRDTRSYHAVEKRSRVLGLREQLLEQRAQEVKEQLTDLEKIPFQTYDTIWENVWELQESLRPLSLKVSKLHYKFTEPIGIAFLSDLHIGSLGTDYKTLYTHVKTIQETKGLYCVLIGEFCEFYKAREERVEEGDWLPPSQQFKLAIDVAMRLRGKALAIVTGTHEVWVTKQTDIDPVEMIASTTNIPYLKYGGLLEVETEGYSHRIFVRHQFRYESSFNLTHAVKRMLEQYEDFDIGVLGHRHKAAIEQVEVKGRQRLFIRCGTYKLEDSYADRLGFRPDTEVLMPMIVLKQDKVYPFIKYEEGIDFLKYLQTV
ncbi:hypothetical protein DRP04_09465 [Archaeoglobales archaeon]|nr:MAG: hypothetical protein DRP04_09465 [Archaeoglobales archaeon]